MASFSTSARCRRARQTSSEESATGAFGISNTRFRVGAPPVRPLPLKDARLPVDDETRRRVTAAARRILKDHGVPKPPEAPDPYDFIDGGFNYAEYENVYISLRSIPDVPETSRPTIMIEAEWKGSSSAATWGQVVKTLKQFVNKSYSEGRISVDFDVEMIATDLAWPVYTYGLCQLESQWPTTSRRILGILESSDTSRGWVRLISLERSGHYPFNDKIRPVTVYIAVAYEFDEGQWQPVIEAIEEYLSSLPHVPLLRLEHNDWNYGFWDSVTCSRKEFDWSRIFASIYMKGYQEEAVIGSDISANQCLFNQKGERFHPAIGTLGCFIEVKARGGQWKKLALTSYQAVRPALQGTETEADDSDMATPPPTNLLSKSDHQGIRPEKSPLVFDHPSRRKHDEIMGILEGQLDRTLEDRESYYTKKEFFDQDQQVLGTLWAASGLKRRSKSNNRLDWALLDVSPHRQGTNTLPSHDSWRQAGYLWGSISSKKLHVPRSSYKDTTLKSMTPGRIVCKVGATSGPTQGFLHGYKATTKFAHDANLELPESVEFEVRSFDGLKRPFSKWGDSGSAVYDRLGHLIGLLFATLEDQRNEGRPRTLVTPIQDIFEDIKAFTGVDDIRIAQP